MDKKLTSHEGEHVKFYEISFKIKVIEYAIEHGNHETNKIFRVDCKRVQEWQQKQVQPEKVTDKTKRVRLTGAGQKIRYPDSEESDGLH